MAKRAARNWPKVPKPTTPIVRGVAGVADDGVERCAMLFGVGLDEDGGASG